jgi:ribosome-associated translation inhibitor RaiA
MKRRRLDSIQINVYCNTKGVIMIINKTEAQDILDAIEAKIDELEQTHKSKDKMQILRLQDLYMELTKFILTGAD